MVCAGFKEIIMECKVTQLLSPGGNIGPMTGGGSLTQVRAGMLTQH